MTNPHDSIEPREILASEEHGHEHVHVTPFWTMFWVFAILLFLTALTVWTANIHYIPVGNSVIEIGATLHILIAMTIATVKAVLVAAYFMHLKYDKPVNTIVVVSTIFGVILFLGLTLTDTISRGIHDRREQGEIHAGGDMTLYSNPGRLERMRAAAQGGVEGSVVQQSVASGEAVVQPPPADNENQSADH
ncbi:MAG: hypothetical protein EA380_06260 [Phycisphaeraceae bacterium]|nr:MAG: hypothetical protein EA380_06260 [Phycisphaeraceae bacterium]